ncbi:MAG: LicD family protein [Clostridia bacterium]|nr:LicD family protein [Clostridia bacterium]
MQKLIFTDETAKIAQFYKTVKPKGFTANPVNSGRAFKKYLLVTDDNGISKMLLSSLLMSPKAKSIYYAEYTTDTFVNKKESLSSKIVDLDNFGSKINDTAVIVYADCEKYAAADDFYKTLNNAISRVKNGKKNKIVIVSVMPQFTLPNDTQTNATSFAEREIGYILDTYIKDKTPQQIFFNELEAYARKLVQEDKLNVTVLRVANPIGSGVSSVMNQKIEDIINSGFENGKLVIENDDFVNKYSFSYIADICCAALYTADNSLKGNIYNFCSFDSCFAEIKRQIHGLFSSELSLEESIDKNSRLSYYCVNTLKYRKTRYKTFTGINTSIARIISGTTNKPLNNEKNIAIYSGRLDRIKSLELETLKEIDRICRKHNIQYFLAGGTMLGSIRYGKSIPWDDDLDLGFLRPDFDKFREALNNGELGDRFVHSCYYNGSGSNYVVDKIRLKDTYFSTNYSSCHRIDDGVFVDLLVYDITPKNKKKSYRHYRLAALFQKLIEALWLVGKEKKIKSKTRKKIFKLLKRYPINKWQDMFEKVIAKYKNLPHEPGYRVIDGVGKCVSKGTIKIDGLLDVQYVDFEEKGFKAPIPASPEDYLIFAYGPNYINEPRLSSRAAPHNYARIDLGSYIFNNEGDDNYRHVDNRGELYESDN